MHNKSEIINRNRQDIPFEIGVLLCSPNKSIYSSDLITCWLWHRLLSLAVLDAEIKTRLLRKPTAFTHETSKLFDLIWSAQIFILYFSPDLNGRDAPPTCVRSRMRKPAAIWQGEVIETTRFVVGDAR